MGKAWVEQYAIAAQTFDLASEILDMNLRELCFEGPVDRLNRTDMAQVAIYVTSVACHRALVEEKELPQWPNATAGLSLGEFTALHLAGAFSFEDGLELVKLRGRAMQEAAEATPSGMVAVIGGDDQQINELCDAARGEGVLVPANYNSPGQIVISGDLSACERAAEVADTMGLRANPLRVAGAFHSPLMQPAADRLAAALDQVTWQTPHAIVWSNATGQPHDVEDLESIKHRLVEQLTNPVRWTHSMLRASQDYRDARFIELAPGKVLSGLMRRTERKVKVENFAEPKVPSKAAS